MKILIVDDSSDDRALLKHSLEKHGHEVIEAVDGQDGLEKAEAHRPDLIISDLLMPKVDGFHFLRNIRKNDLLRRIPFIICSGVYVGDRDKELGISLGANAFIEKPVDADKLWGKIKSAIEGICHEDETVVRDLLEEDIDFLRNYSSIVAARLEDKTRDLEREIIERKRLEREIAEIISQERQRVGNELHDGLGQVLTGAAFVCKAMEHKLYEKKLSEYEDSRKIKELLNEAIKRVKEIAAGLSPLMIANIGLDGALRQLAESTEDIYGIKCAFTAIIDAPVQNSIIAEQLYYIACEAVTNAVKHANAKNISVALRSNKNAISLVIEDDGIGFGKGIDYNKGMGLRIMKYRVDTIDGSLDIRHEDGGKTSLVCSLKLMKT